MIPSLLTVLAGCSGGVIAPPYMENPGGNIPFKPSLVSAQRFPKECGIANPPWTSQDVISLEIVDQTTTAPYNALSLQYMGSVTAGAPLALTVAAYQPHGSQANGGPWFAAQNASFGAISFQYSQGTDPAEIDTGAFKSVTLTFESVPSADGDPLTVRVQIAFDDGKLLDETFSASISSAMSGCAAG